MYISLICNWHFPVSNPAWIRWENLATKPTHTYCYLLPSLNVNTKSHDTSCKFKSYIPYLKLISMNMLLFVFSFFCKLVHDSSCFNLMINRNLTERWNWNDFIPHWLWKSYLFRKVTLNKSKENKVTNVERPGQNTAFVRGGPTTSS